MKKSLDAGVKVKAYDPVAIHETQRVLGDKIYYAPDQYDALIDADCLMLVTEWPEFKNLDYKKIKKSMVNPVLIDGRNLLDPAQMKAIGFEYKGMGK